MNTKQALVLEWAKGVIDSRPADFKLTLPDGTVQFERWYVVPNNDQANVYIHRFSASDPRVFHDHPSDHMGIVLSGEYREYVPGEVHTRKEGSVIFRKAEQFHYIVLPPKSPPAITLFTTGPRRRTWGFFTKTGWRPYTDFIAEDGTPIGDPLR